MITIFTIPKPFIGHINIIQRNAIKSWTYLNPKCEIILCGNDHGTDEVAREFGIKCIPDVTCNEFGTPLLSSAFEKVKNLAINDLMCYVNSDIIFLSDFIQSVKRIELEKYLVIGNRWNIDINEEINFNDDGWEKRIINYVNNEGIVQPPLGSDYFIFKRFESLSNISEFAVGRPGWDNWFIYNARLKKYKVIDATKAIMAIHQNHDYSHMKKYHTEKAGTYQWQRWEGPEVNKNKELMSDMKKFFSLLDATHILTKDSLNSARDYEHLRRYYDTIPIFYPKFDTLFNFIDRIILPVIRKCKRYFIE